MMRLIFVSTILFGLLLNSCGKTTTNASTANVKPTMEIVDQSDSDKNKVLSEGNYNTLNANEQYVILKKGTERAFTGKFVNNKAAGTYICRQCNQPLFTSESKFKSGTGWPSFDDGIKDAVLEVPDADGRRTEIVCGNCDGHLGHVFKNEGFTDKNTRHCVNSVSLDFIPKTN